MTESYEPTQSEIDSYVSACDGDISDGYARKELIVIHERARQGLKCRVCWQKAQKEIDRLTAEKQALAERIEKLESAKSEPGEDSSCGIVKGLLDQLGRHRNLFDRLVAENNAQAERIVAKDEALKTIGARSMDYAHMTGTLHRDMQVIHDTAKAALAEAGKKE